MRLNQKSIKSMKHFTRRALFKCLLETRFIPCILHIEITRRKVLLNRMASNDCCTTVETEIFHQAFLKRPVFIFYHSVIHEKREEKKQNWKAKKFSLSPILLLSNFRFPKSPYIFVKNLLKTEY